MANSGTEFATLLTGAIKLAEGVNDFVSSLDKKPEGKTDRERALENENTRLEAKVGELSDEIRDLNRTREATQATEYERFDPEIIAGLIYLHIDRYSDLVPFAQAPAEIQEEYRSTALAIINYVKPKRKS